MMFASVKREIPEFLSDEIIYCDTVTNDRKQRSCLILLRNLMFYEFRQKTAIKSLDLRTTCLTKVQQQLQNYNGSRGKWHDVSTVECPEDEVTSHQHTLQLMESEINFGKYIYQNFEIKKLFILIKCWDKLIVLRSTETEDKNLVLVGEYEDVSAYRLVHGRIKFQACVEIKYENVNILRTDFHEDDQKNLFSPDNNQTALKRDNFKLLLERIRSAKTELFVHKSITQREYARLKTTQTFGCNFLHSELIEEKQLLAKCGDVWMRLTPNDYLVIGVLLVNNGSAEACTVLTNIRPVFDSNDKATFSYSFRLYQLHQSFIDLETLETFFQAEDESRVEPVTNIWNATETPKLLPESLAVLCIKLRLSEAITLQTAPLFIFFDIDRDISSMTKETMVFNQQVFIKNMHFNILLSNRVQYEITFEESTVHQDFLAIAVSSVETKLALIFEAETDVEKFEQLLMQRFDLVKMLRCTSDAKKDAMEVDNQKHFPHFLYYNQKQSSIWYGALILRCAGENYQRNGIEISWKFYVKSEEKLFMLVKLILNELLLLKCNITEIRIPNHNTSSDKIIEFENALRKELNHALLCCDEETSKKTPSKLEDERHSKMEQLLQLEMQTDLLAKLVIKVD